MTEIQLGHTNSWLTAEDLFNTFNMCVEVTAIHKKNDNHLPSIVSTDLIEDKKDEHLQRSVVDYWDKFYTTKFCNLLNTILYQKESTQCTAAKVDNEINRIFNPTQKRKKVFRKMTDKKVFHCNTCGKKFPSQLFLRKHKTIVHSKRVRDQGLTVVDSGAAHEHSKSLMSDSTDSLVSTTEHESLNTESNDSSVSVISNSANLIVIDNYPNVIQSETDTPRQTDLLKKQSSEIESNTTSSSDKPFGCLTCGKKFSLRIALNKHRATHHVKKEINLEVDYDGGDDDASLTSDTSNNSADSPVPMKSDNEWFLCNMHDKRPESVGKILVDTTGRGCFLCNMFKKKGQSGLVKKVYSCSLCFTNFPTIKSLRKHQETHYRQKRYKCRSCEKRFRDESKWKEHEAEHKKEKSFLTCRVCGDGFKTPNSLRVHLVSHSSDKPFSCSMCDASFKHMHQLKVHYSKHVHNTATYTKHRQGKDSFTEETISIKDEDDCETILLLDLQSTEESSTTIAPPPTTVSTIANTTVKTDMMESTPPFDTTATTVTSALLTSSPPVVKKSRVSENEVKSLTRNIATSPNSAKHTSGSDVKINYEKKTCDLTLSKEDIDKPPSFMCEVCGKTFPLRVQLKKHGATHKSRTKKVSCRHCDRKFYSKIVLHNHEKSHERKALLEDRSNKSESDKGSLATDVKNGEILDLCMDDSDDDDFVKHSCPTCAKTFISLVSLQKHKQNKHGVVEKILQVEHSSITPSAEES